MRHTKKSQYKDIAERVIYLLLFPATKEFFIFHCPKKSIRDYYRQHMHGTYYKTQQHVEELKKQNLHPCFFVLEEVNTTKVDAYNYVIVWTKIFSEAGYIGLDQGNVSVYKDNLLDRNILLYDNRKNADLPMLTNCEHCLVKIYNHSHCKLAPDYIEPATKTENQSYLFKDKKALSISVSPEEHERIKMNAQACNQSISSFVKQNALDAKVIKPDLSIFSEHTTEIHDNVMAVMQLIYTIKKCGTYVPADLEYILEKTRAILNSQKKLLVQYEKHIVQDLKRVEKEVSEYVKKRTQNKGSKDENLSGDFSTQSNHR